MDDYHKHKMVLHTVRPCDPHPLLDGLCFLFAIGFDPTKIFELNKFIFPVLLQSSHLINEHFEKRNFVFQQRNLGITNREVPIYGIYHKGDIPCGKIGKQCLTNFFQMYLP